MDPRVPERPAASRGPRVRSSAPLPDRDGVPPARFSMPTGTSWERVAPFLLDRTRGAPEVARALAAGAVRLGDGTVVTEHTAYAPGQWVYLHRELAPEVPVPGELTVLAQDERIIVVDKPPFLATMPRGRHVTQSVVVRLRRQPGLEQVVPAHRLDRLTAGVLMLTKDPAVRAPYQELFATRAAQKRYRAVVRCDPGLAFPDEVRSRIEKPRGQLQAVEVPAGAGGGEVNAITRIEVLERRGERALLELTPLTGRTHQLRLHLCRLGAPIVGDPLYPDIVEVAPDDFSTPLQLVAAELAFTDPLTGESRRFVSSRVLDLS